MFSLFAARSALTRSPMLRPTTFLLGRPCSSASSFWKMSSKKQLTLSHYFSSNAAGGQKSIVPQASKSPSKPVDAATATKKATVTHASKRKSTRIESDSESEAEKLTGKENTPELSVAATVETVVPKYVEVESEAEEEQQKSEATQVDSEHASKKQKIHETAGEKAAYVPDFVWPEVDGKTPFATLCKAFEAIEATSKRLQILDILTHYLEGIITHSPKDLLPSVYLCINKLCPTWEGVELGIGENLIMKAIASATGRSMQKIKQDLGEHGDLGKVAQVSRSNQPVMFQPKPLILSSVYNTLFEIANISGHSSMNKKIDKIKFLLVSCRDNESKYLVRALEGKLRIGLAEQTVIVALAQAAVIARKEDIDLQTATEIFKQVYSELPTYNSIIPVLLKHGVRALADKCKLTPGVPLKPMLAHPTKAISEVLNRFENIKFTCEYKYDGERAQIHKLENGKFVIFSRNQENMSEKYPDIVQHMAMIPKEHVRSFVLDSEAVAWDKIQNKILPFQVLSTRKRKDVTSESIVVQVCVFAFDLLYLNGESLIRKSLRERRELLYKSFNEVPGQFMFAKQMEGQSVEEIQTFLDESIDGNCEGLMVKTLDTDSSYEPSKRSRNWLKVKKDYLDGAGDSLDLVVIGGYTGKGKRTGGYGGFLLACYDDDREEYQAICKIGTGFSDENLAEHAKFFKEHESQIPKPYYSYGEGVKPDVWFEPVQVWEIKTADLSISPIYKAGVGLVDPGKGISLRFPRFIRIRDDKGPDQATTSTQVADMYRNQKIHHGPAAGGADDDFDY